MWPVKCLQSQCYTNSLVTTGILPPAMNYEGVIKCDVVCFDHIFTSTCINITIPVS